MTVDTAVARRWKRLRNIQGWNVMRWRRGLGFLFPLPPHICHCLFLSPPRLECRSAPPLSRPRTSVSAAVAFNASALPPRGILVRPRASVFVYLLRLFPSATVRWPPTPVNFVRPRASVFVYLLRPFPSAAVRLPPTPFNFVRPRASVFVYLLRPFPSAAVRWPPTPFNFVRPRASVFVYLLRPFPSAAVRWPPTPFNFVRLSRRLPVAPVLLIRRPLVDAAVVLPAPPRLRCATRKSWLRICMSCSLFTFFWLAILPHRQVTSLKKLRCAIYTSDWFQASNVFFPLPPAFAFHLGSCIVIILFAQKEKKSAVPLRQIRKARIAKCHKHRTKQGHLASLATIAALAPLEPLPPLLPQPLKLVPAFYVTKVE